ncbi:MAG: leucine-rich repeat domain-containing protein, partial [Deltaproteobacteria bacterium]|nr:leucine-rich repeat domain-containing protein [Deltaproteobacteria bacterium]
SVTGVSDLRPLGNCFNLQRLILASTKVSNLGPLRNLDRLAELNLSRTQVKELGPLAGLSRLSDLRLDRTPVDDISTLAALKELESLDLSVTSVTDLTPLRNLPKLRRLDLSHTRISDLSPLQRMPNLEVLRLDYTAVSDLSPLGELKKLHTIGMVGTPVKDLGPLASILSLWNLVLASDKGLTTQLESLLKKLPGLDVIRLDDGANDWSNELSASACLGTKKRHGIIILSLEHRYDTPEPICEEEKCRLSTRLSGIGYPSSKYNLEVETVAQAGKPQVFFSWLETDQYCRPELISPIVEYGPATVDQSGSNYHDLISLHTREPGNVSLAFASLPDRKDCKIHPMGNIKWSLLEGECRDGYATGHGKGRGRNDGGEFYYLGGFEQGWLHGEGSLFMTEGSVTHGSFEKGVGEGLHHMYDSMNQSRYAGQFKADMRHGPGKYVVRGGLRFEGRWEKDDYVDGTLTYLDGGVFTGTFKERKRHGRGVMIHPDGRKQDGMWKDDEYIVGH